MARQTDETTEDDDTGCSRPCTPADVSKLLETSKSQKINQSSADVKLGETRKTVKNPLPKNSVEDSKLNETKNNSKNNQSKNNVEDSKLNDTKKSSKINQTNSNDDDSKLKNLKKSSNSNQTNSNEEDSKLNDAKTSSKTNLKNSNTEDFKLDETNKKTSRSSQSNSSAPDSKLNDTKKSSKINQSNSNAEESKLTEVKKSSKSNKLSSSVEDSKLPDPKKSSKISQPDSNADVELSETKKTSKNAQPKNNTKDSKLDENKISSKKNQPKGNAKDSKRNDTKKSSKSSQSHCNDELDQENSENNQISCKAEVDAVKEVDDKSSIDARISKKPIKNDDRSSSKNNDGVNDEETRVNRSFTEGRRRSSKSNSKNDKTLVKTDESSPSKHVELKKTTDSKRLSRSTAKSSSPCAENEESMANPSKVKPLAGDKEKVEKSNKDLLEVDKFGFVPDNCDKNSESLDNCDESPVFKKSRRSTKSNYRIDSDVSPVKEIEKDVPETKSSSSRRGRRSANNKNVKSVSNRTSAKSPDSKSYISHDHQDKNEKIPKDIETSNDNAKETTSSIDNLEQSHDKKKSQSNEDIVDDEVFNKSNKESIKNADSIAKLNLQSPPVNKRGRGRGRGRGARRGSLASRVDKLSANQKRIDNFFVKIDSKSEECGEVNIVSQNDDDAAVSSKNNAEEDNKDKIVESNIKSSDLENSVSKEVPKRRGRPPKKPKNSINSPEPPAINVGIKSSPKQNLETINKSTDTEDNNLTKVNIDKSSDSTKSKSESSDSFLFSTGSRKTSDPDLLDSTPVVITPPKSSPILPASKQQGSNFTAVGSVDSFQLYRSATGESTEIEIEYAKSTKLKLMI